MLDSQCLLSKTHLQN